MFEDIILLPICTFWKETLFSFIDSIIFYFKRPCSHSDWLFEQITHWRKKGNTHQGHPGEDGHDVNHADVGVPHTSNVAQGDSDRQAGVDRQ